MESQITSPHTKSTAAFSADRLVDFNLVLIMIKAQLLSKVFAQICWPLCSLNKSQRDPQWLELDSKYFRGSASPQCTWITGLCFQWKKVDESRCSTYDSARVLGRHAVQSGMLALDVV